MMECRAIRKSGGIECARCHISIPVTEKELAVFGGNLSRIHRSCQAPGLGDYAAAFLGAWGITPRAVNAIKERLGMKKPCKCPERRERLNWADAVARKYLLRPSPLFGVPWIYVLAVLLGFVLSIYAQFR